MAEENKQPQSLSPAPVLNASQQELAQKKLAERLFGEHSHHATVQQRGLEASTSTLLTTDAHVGKRTGEPHKDQAQEDLKVGAAGRTIDETAKPPTVEIGQEGGPKDKDGKPVPTDTAVTNTAGQSLAAPQGVTADHRPDAVGVTGQVEGATGKPQTGEPAPAPGTQPPAPAPKVTPEDEKKAAAPKPDEKKP